MANTTQPSIPLKPSGRLWSRIFVRRMIRDCQCRTTLERFRNCTVTRSALNQDWTKTLSCKLTTTKKTITSLNHLGKNQFLSSFHLEALSLMDSPLRTPWAIQTCLLCLSVWRWTTRREWWVTKWTSRPSTCRADPARCQWARTQKTTSTSKKTCQMKICMT